MKRLLPSLFFFIALTTNNMAQQFNPIQNDVGRSYFQNVEISGLYHPNVSNTHVYLPQVPLLHNYMHSSVHRMYYAAQTKLSDELKNILEAVIDFDETEPEFYISIQNVGMSKLGNDYFFANDIDNIRPHYAIFKDATIDNPSILDKSYNRDAQFEETFILPLMETSLVLTEATGSISAHPGENHTVLSGNNYKMVGDNSKPWLFISYFRTTTGRQLITLHYILNPSDSENLVDHFNEAQGRPFNTQKDVLNFLKQRLNNHSIDAVSEIALNGRLTDFSREKLEIAIAQKQYVDRTINVNDRLKKLENKLGLFQKNAREYLKKEQDADYVKAHYNFLNQKIAEMSIEFYQLNQSIQE